MTDNPYTKKYHKPSTFESFLWFCAGADKELLPYCPSSDRVKYQGIGGIIFATGILAFVSSSYAFWTVFSPKVKTTLESGIDVESTAAIVGAVIAGMLWGLVIFNIDRFIVSSTGTGDGTSAITWSEFWQACPRLFMAVLIGFCLSTPLELRILQPEIDAQLELEQREHMNTLNESTQAQFTEKEERYISEIKAREAKLETQKQKIDERQLEIDANYRRLELEAEGKTGTGAAGRGPAWRDKKANLDRQLVMLNNMKTELKSDKELIGAQIDDRRKLLDNLRTDKELEFQKNKQAAYNFDGLLKRIEIAHEIGGLMKWVLTLLLVSIEVGPIFFKMMIAKGTYDYLKENKQWLTMAENGVFLDNKLIQHPDGSMMESQQTRNFALEKKKEERENQFLTELELMKKVHLEYKRQMEADIEQNLDKYIEDV